MFQKFKQLFKTNKQAFLPLIPFFISEVLFIFVSQYKNELPWTNYILWIGIFDKFILDSLLFLAGIFLLPTIYKRNFLPFFFAGFYIFSTVLDSAIYLFGNTRFEKHFLDLVAGYAILGFMNIGFVIILIILFFVFFFLSKTITIAKKHSSFALGVLFLALFGVLQFANITGFITKKSEGNIHRHWKNESEKHQNFLLRCRNDEIKYMKKNSFLNVLNELFSAKHSSEYKVSQTIKPFQKIIKKYQLPLGKRKYKDLELKKFKHIILLSNESFSSAFISAYNKNFPKPTTPNFFDKPDIVAKTFQNYYTTASPTLFGLTSMWNSNPNYYLILKGKKFKNALPSILRKNGFKTIFIRGASKFYAHENTIFQNMGFQKIIAREDFAKNPKLKRYIWEWGVSDRIVLNKLIEVLKKNKNNKLFIQFLGINTHPPDGRNEYQYNNTFKIPYPKFPDDFKKLGRQYKYLRSVYQLDFDMKLFIEKLKKNGLFTPDTLIIVTADHACPRNSVTRNIKGFPMTNLAKIPLIFLSKQQLPFIRNNILSSQIDLAPTILHLLNIPIPQGYWGDSLFSNRKRAEQIGFHRGRFILKNKKMEDNFSPYRKKDFRKLFNTIIY